MVLGLAPARLAARDAAGVGTMPISPCLDHHPGKHSPDQQYKGVLVAQAHCDFPSNDLIACLEFLWH